MAVSVVALRAVDEADGVLLQERRPGQRAFGGGREGVVVLQEVFGVAHAPVACVAGLQEARRTWLRDVGHAGIGFGIEFAAERFGRSHTGEAVHEEHAGAVFAADHGADGGAVETFAAGIHRRHAELAEHPFRRRDVAGVDVAAHIGAVVPSSGTFFHIKDVAVGTGRGFERIFFTLPTQEDAAFVDHRHEVAYGQGSNDAGVQAVHTARVAQQRLVDGTGHREAPHRVEADLHVLIVLMGERLENHAGDAGLAALAVVALIKLAAVPAAVGPAHVAGEGGHHLVGQIATGQTGESGGVEAVHEGGGVNGQCADVAALRLSGVGVNGQRELQRHVQAVALFAPGLHRVAREGVHTAAVDAVFGQEHAAARHMVHGQRACVDVFGVVVGAVLRHPDGTGQTVVFGPIAAAFPGASFAAAHPAARDAAHAAAETHLQIPVVVAEDAVVLGVSGLKMPGAQIAPDAEAHAAVDGQTRLDALVYDADGHRFVGLRIAHIDRIIALLKDVSVEHFVLLPARLAGREDYGAGALEHRDEEGIDDGRGEEILAGGVEQRTLINPLPFVVLVVISVRGPQRQMTAVESLFGRDGAIEIAHPRLAPVVETAPAPLPVAGQKEGGNEFVERVAAHRDEERTLAISLRHAGTHLAVDALHRSLREGLSEKGLVELQLHRVAAKDDVLHAEAFAAGKSGVGIIVEIGGERLLQGLVLREGCGAEGEKQEWQQTSHHRANFSGFLPLKSLK